MMGNVAKALMIGHCLAARRHEATNVWLALSRLPYQLAPDSLGASRVAVQMAYLGAMLLRAVSRHTRGEPRPIAASPANAIGIWGGLLRPAPTPQRLLGRNSSKIAIPFWAGRSSFPGRARSPLGFSQMEGQLFFPFSTSVQSLVQLSDRQLRLRTTQSPIIVAGRRMA